MAAARRRHTEHRLDSKRRTTVPTPVAVAAIDVFIVADRRHVPELIAAIEEIVATETNQSVVHHLIKLAACNFANAAADTAQRMLRAAFPTKEIHDEDQA